jgi:hypothetical protein
MEQSRKLNIKNIQRVLETNTHPFRWLEIAPMPDRYTFHIESDISNTIYYLDLYRFDEHKNGTYRLMLTNSKYRNTDNKKWLTLNDIQNMSNFKRMCIDLITNISWDEPPF